MPRSPARPKTRATTAVLVCSTRRAESVERAGGLPVAAASTATMHRSMRPKQSIGSSYGRFGGTDPRSRCDGRLAISVDCGIGEQQSVLGNWDSRGRAYRSPPQGNGRSEHCRSPGSMIQEFGSHNVAALRKRGDCATVIVSDICPYCILNQGSQTWSVATWQPPWPGIDLRKSGKPGRGSGLPQISYSSPKSCPAGLDRNADAVCQSCNHPASDRR